MSAPASPSATAIVLPSPRAPPVIRAVLPFSRNESRTLLCANLEPPTPSLQLLFERRVGIQEQPAKASDQVNPARDVERERPVLVRPGEEVADDQRRQRAGD